MKFEDDAFISYAHLDNVELVEGRKGWVTNLHRALEVRVAQLLGKPPHIWRDLKLTGNDLFTESILARLGRAAVLLAVVSPRYLKSEWTNRELDAFCSATAHQGGVGAGDKARVFKIMKTPVPVDKMPPSLQGLLGYEFFKVDPETGKVRELDEIFGADAQRDFWLELEDLAHDVKDLLEAIEGPDPATATAPTTAPGVRQRSVYLAETTTDLRDVRESLRRDFREHGYRVLPDHPLPLVAADADAAIREAISQCGLSIHPIGRSYGVVPECGDRSLVERQHEIASERDGSASFSRIIWIPEGLQVQDARQQQVIAHLRSDPHIGHGADLIETFFEGLRTVIQGWIKKDQLPPPAAEAKPGPSAPAVSAPRLYLIADQRDCSNLGAWADALFKSGVEVLKPIFEGQEAEIREYHEDCLLTCDGVLLFFGSGNELWVRRKLREIQKAAGYGRTKPQPPVCICLIGSHTDEKEQLRTHEATVVPQWNGVDLAELGSFLQTLRAGGGV